MAKEMHSIEEKQQYIRGIVIQPSNGTNGTKGEFRRIGRFQVVHFEMGDEEKFKSFLQALEESTASSPCVEPHAYLEPPDERFVLSLI
jgi:hypothetical protein